MLKYSVYHSVIGFYNTVRYCVEKYFSRYNKCQRIILYATVRQRPIRTALFFLVNWVGDQKQTQTARVLAVWVRFWRWTWKILVKLVVTFVRTPLYHMSNRYAIWHTVLFARVNHDRCLTPTMYLKQSSPAQLLC